MSIWQRLDQEVDPSGCLLPLATFCFMAGFIDSISFSATYVWCGFQTGNFAQLALAIARLWENPHRYFHIADQQALCSLISFWFGAFLGRFGARVGRQKRIWLIVGNLLAAMFMAIAAIAIWKSGQASVANHRDLPAWSNARTFVGIAGLSITLGIQGTLAKGLSSQLGTTLVLTTLWVELFNDLNLFKIGRVKGRDHRIIGAFCLFLGAFISRALLYEIGSAGTIGVGVGIKLINTFFWLWMPAKPTST
ncbi:hypothetical protein CPB83DRAFT_770960 [Crepidotus variabilis]|uniref:DUF1275 domain protein n=1 Tax=Crepidotus variabilis TaxID=179855 RepID=A0A9P6EBQ9_9AGAR|nr:hypothetical protein CPB83DRAFT_770960 [Crepidotus variabilis]